MYGLPDPKVVDGVLIVKHSKYAFRRQFDFASAAKHNLSCRTN